MSLNYNKLTWVLTKAGINEIRRVLADPDSTLQLTKFKFGDANGTYYIPTGSETALVNQCVDSSGNLVEQVVTGKEISTVTMVDSNGNPIVNSNNEEIQYDVVNINTYLPENSCDYQIMEVGLYGLRAVDNQGTTEEYLFALSTCSPIPKPDIDDNYVMSINYTASFISSNLLAIYNRIVLDTNNQFATVEDLDDMINSMLYVTGNLAEQINHNSHILGLNRVTQLSERITEDEKNIVLTASVSNCNTIKSILGYENVKNYWIFKDTGAITTVQSIKDYGIMQNDLTLTNLPSSLNPSTVGLAYSLNINNGNYFYLSDTSSFTLNTATGAFTLIFSLENNNVNETNTFLSQYGVFDITKEYNATYGIRFVLNMYGTSNTSLHCFTPYYNGLSVNDINTLIVSYNGNYTNPTVNFFINLSCISTSIVTTESETTGGIIKTGNFTQLTTNNNQIGSYLAINNIPSNFIDSKTCVICKVDDIFLESNSTVAKSLSLLLQSYMGNNKCLII